MNTNRNTQEPTTCTAVDIHLHGEAPIVHHGIGDHTWVKAGPLAIHGDRPMLIAFAASILEQLRVGAIELPIDMDPRQNEHTPFGIVGDVTTVEVSELLVGDTVTVPDWPDERWEIVTRFDELAPGYLDIHVETGERFTWPADHAVQVRLPRPMRPHYDFTGPEHRPFVPPSQIRSELADTVHESGLVDADTAGAER